MTTTRTLLSLPAAVAGALGLVAGEAGAVPINEMTGDPTTAPFYISQALMATTPADGSSSQFIGQQEGLLYSSNAGPMPLTSVDMTITQNGATFEADAWTIANGFYSSRNYASMTVTNAQETDGYYAVAGYGTRTQVQFFTPEAAAARSQFTWRVTGTEVEPYGWADARMDFLAGSYSGASFYDVYNTGETYYGPGTYTYNLDTPLDTPIDLFFWSSAFVQLDQGLAQQGDNVTLTADYGSTYELIDIDLFDAAGNLLSGWWMVDLVSGDTVFTDQGRGSGEEPTSVPEPGSLALFGLALLGMGAARRRRLAHNPL